MVSPAAVLILALAVPGGDPIRSSLQEGQYPWYDAGADALKPLKAPPETTRSSAPDVSLPGGSSLPSIGQFFAFLALAVALAALVAGLAWAWGRYHPDPDDLARGPARAGSSARVGDLPPSLRVDTDDPWGLALRLRAEGNLEEAIICAFVHQILTLARLGLIRPVPGRTPRQLVRSVEERRIRSLVEPSLRLFEAAYYGHHAPDPVAFEAAWARAEEFAAWATTGAAP